MAWSIEAIAQRVPAAPKEESDTTSSDATAIDCLKITSNKDRQSLCDDCLNAAAANSKTKRLPVYAIPTSNRRSSSTSSSRECAADETEFGKRQRSAMKAQKGSHGMKVVKRKAERGKFTFRSLS
jgi:hypothetical protein